MRNHIFFFLFLFTASAAHAVPRTYRCFDLYNFYGNLRYEYFDGESDFATLRHLILEKDKGTLSIDLQTNLAIILGFDEKRFDGPLQKENAVVKNPQGFSILNQEGDGIGLSIQAYTPSDAPADINTDLILKAAIFEIHKNQISNTQLELMCGLAEENDTEVDWSFGKPTKPKTPSLGNGIPTYQTHTL